MDQNKNNDIEQIKHFYDTVYYKNSSAKLSVSRHLKNLAQRCYLKKNDKILDIGCGKGNWLLACSKYGVKPFGIDLSEKAISICQSNMPEGNFYAQAAETLPFENKTFDFISCLGSLEHFVDQVSAVKEMVRVSKDDANYLLLVPNKDFLTRKLRLYSGTYQTDAREIVRPIEEWEKIFNQAGLTVINKEKDLHVLSWEWLTIGKWYTFPVRLIQALLLIIWPIKWQYQVYFFCKKI